MLMHFILAVVVQAAVHVQPADVRRLTVSAPEQAVEVPSEAINGNPIRLAWSPDGKILYVRSVKSDIWGNQTISHYQVTISSREFQAIATEPDWCGRYWLWKSAQSSPAAEDFRITYETTEERKTAVGVANAGSMAQSGGDPSFGAALGEQGAAIASIATQGQMVRTTTLKLKGQPLGEFVNMMPIPGLTFGWAPRNLGVIAYVGKKGRLILMDKAGRRRQLPAIENAVLPAWSEDGRRLAWVERAKKKVTIRIANVSVD